MKEIYSEIETNAPAVRVWKSLTDFAGFPELSPLIRRVSGEAKSGSRLEVYMTPEQPQKSKNSTCLENQDSSRISDFLISEYRIS